MSHRGRWVALRSPILHQTKTAAPRSRRFVASQEAWYQLFLPKNRRRIAPRPIRPAPSSVSDAGSGTGGGGWFRADRLAVKPADGVVVQVGVGVEVPVQDPVAPKLRLNALGRKSPRLSDTPPCALIEKPSTSELFEPLSGVRIGEVVMPVTVKVKVSPPPF